MSYLLAMERVIEYILNYENKVVKIICTAIDKPKADRKR